MQSDLKTEKKILNISFVGTLIFLICEVGAAWYTHSIALLMDCVYDTAELIMIGPFLLLIPQLYKPISERHPFGYSQVESVFVIIKYSILLIVDISLIVDSISIVIDGGNHINATAVAIFEIAMCIGCVAMYLFLSRLNRKFSTPSIKAELFIWKLDSYATLGVGAAFIIALLLEKTRFAFVAPYADPVIAIVLAVILLREPISMIVESFKGLLLFAPDKKVCSHIMEVSEKVLAQYGIQISFFDTVKTGRYYWVDLHIRTSDGIINTLELKKAHLEILDELKKTYDNIEVEFMPDLDGGIPKERPARSRRQNEIDFAIEKEKKKEQKKNQKKGTAPDGK